MPLDPCIIIEAAVGNDHVIHGLPWLGCSRRVYKAAVCLSTGDTRLLSVSRCMYVCMLSRVIGPLIEHTTNVEESVVLQDEGIWA